MVAVVIGIAIDQKPSLATRPVVPPFQRFAVFVFPKIQVFRPFFEWGLGRWAFLIFPTENELTNIPLAAIRTA